MEKLKLCKHQDAEHWVNNVGKKHLSEDQIEHILDFFDSDDAPRRLRKMSVSDAVRLTDKWVKKLHRKGENVVETEEDVKEILDLDEMRLVQLISKTSYKREGYLMSHCVASYHNKECKVYSLRDIKNKPHATIEISKRGDRIEQIKGKGNGSIHPRYIKYVLKVLNHFNLEVKDSELKYLGYVSLADAVWEELKNWNKVKEMTWCGKRYFYLPSGPKLTRKIDND